MSVVLYAIADARPGTIDGIDGELRLVGEPGLVAVVADRTSPTEGAPDELGDYEGVIERLMESHSVLPARFGSVVRDDDEARALLERRAPELGARLALVSGAVELGLRVAWGSEPPVENESGTSYMYARLARLRRARELAARLGPLDPLSRRRRVSIAPHGELAVEAAYLVERSRVGEFIAAVERIDQQLDDAALVCTGPWPPYSFAQGATS